MMNFDSVWRPVSAVSVAVAAAVSPLSAAAQQSFVIQAIEVQGLTRSEPATVLAVLPIKVGDRYTEIDGTAALRAVFATGLFNDVRLDIRGQTLVVVVQERPFVTAINITGLKEFEKPVVMNAFKSLGLVAGQPINRAVLDRVAQDLQQQYQARGLNAAQVSTQLVPDGPDRVRVEVKVVEGSVSTIRSIDLVGAKAISAATLRAEMATGTSSLTSWFSKNDRYAREKLQADVQKLRELYLQRGYLDINIGEPEVVLSEDKKYFDIRLTIQEGVAYVVSGVALKGDFLGREAEFSSLVGIKPGALYQLDAVQTTQEAMQQRFSNYGFAFADVSVQPQTDRQRGVVQLTIQANPRQRVYVRRINISGNNQTRDEVIRREFRQMEASWFDADKIRISRDRIDRLGFFSNVVVRNKEVPGFPDQVDLEVAVTERSTGSVTLGAGFSQSEKVTLQGSVSLGNFLGTGNLLSAEINTSKNARSLGFRTVQPYFTDYGMSRALDVGYRTSRPFNSEASSFELATLTANARFGIPISETDRVFVGGGFERNTIGQSVTLPLAYQQFASQYGRSIGAFPVTLGWERDQRNSLVAPTKGSYQRVNLELSPVGDARYSKANVQVQQHISFTPSISLSLNGEVGYGAGLGKKPYPFFKSFYGGGLGSVRGFDQGSLGITDPTGVYLGGNRSMNLNAELYLPIPGAAKDNGFRFFGFMDAGNVWGQQQQIAVNDIRAAAGVGFSWLSPIGPMSLSYGKPFNAKQGDKIQNLQFQIGTSF